MTFTLKERAQADLEAKREEQRALEARKHQEKVEALERLSANARDQLQRTLQLDDDAAVDLEHVSGDPGGSRITWRTDVEDYEFEVELHATGETRVFLVYEGPVIPDSGGARIDVRKEIRRPADLVDNLITEEVTAR